MVSMKVLAVLAVSLNACAMAKPVDATVSAESSVLSSAGDVSQTITASASESSAYYTKHKGHKHSSGRKVISTQAEPSASGVPYSAVSNATATGGFPFTASNSSGIIVTTDDDNNTSIVYVQPYTVKSGNASFSDNATYVLSGAQIRRLSEMLIQSLSANAMSAVMTDMMTDMVKGAIYDDPDVYRSNIQKAMDSFQDIAPGLVSNVTSSVKERDLDTGSDGLPILSLLGTAIDTTAIMGSSVLTGLLQSATGSNTTIGTGNFGLLNGLFGHQSLYKNGSYSENVGSSSVDLSSLLSGGLGSLLSNLTSGISSDNPLSSLLGSGSSSDITSLLSNAVSGLTGSSSSSDLLSGLSSLIPSTTSSSSSSSDLLSGLSSLLGSKRDFTAHERAYLTLLLASENSLNRRDLLSSVTSALGNATSGLSSGLSGLTSSSSSTGLLSGVTGALNNTASGLVNTLLKGGVITALQDEATAIVNSITQLKIINEASDASVDRSGTSLGLSINALGNALGLGSLSESSAVVSIKAYQSGASALN